MEDGQIVSAKPVENGRKNVFFGVNNKMTRCITFRRTLAPIMSAICVASVLLIISDEGRQQAHDYAQRAQEEYELKLRKAPAIGWRLESCWDCPFSTDHPTIIHNFVLIAVSTPVFPAASLGLLSDVLVTGAGIWMYRSLTVFFTFLFWYNAGRWLDSRSDPQIHIRPTWIVRKYFVLLRLISPVIFAIFLFSTLRYFSTPVGSLLFLLEILGWSMVGTYFFYRKLRMAGWTRATAWLN